MIPQKQIISYRKKGDTIVSEAKNDFISPEFPLEIAVKYQGSSNPSKNIAITMRTPGMDEELACGFLFTEGVINELEDILDITSKENKVDVLLNKQFEENLNKINRHFYTSSSCGICSKSELASIYTSSQYLPFTSSLKISSKSLFDLKHYFEEEDNIFSKTGGLHSCVLIDSKMNKIAYFEDIGRHNAMDKLIGWSIGKKIFPLTDHIVLLSGRISFELVQKASMAGVAFIGALGAPSSLAIEEAYAQSMCLVGFAKSTSFNVYCGNERIVE